MYFFYPLVSQDLLRYLEYEDLRSVLVRFPSSSKIPEDNQLKEDRLILAHGFRDFSPFDSITLRPVARENIKVAEAVVEQS